jgi:hypothetical protein
MKFYYYFFCYTYFKSNILYKFFNTIQYIFIQQSFKWSIFFFYFFQRHLLICFCFFYKLKKNVFINTVLLLIVEKNNGTFKLKSTQENEKLHKVYNNGVVHYEKS